MLKKKKKENVKEEEIQNEFVEILKEKNQQCGSCPYWSQGGI